MSKISSKKVEDEVKSYNGLKFTFFSYKIYGFFPPLDPTKRKIYYGFIIFFHIIFTLFFFPGFYHGVFTSAIENSVEASCSSLVLSNIVLRSAIFWSHRRNIRKSFPMLDELDSNFSTEAEKNILKQAIKESRIMGIVVHTILFLMLAAKWIGIIVNFYGDRVPLFPIWVPYDWITDTTIYLSTMIYQYIAIELHVIGYAANALFSPTSICMVIGYIKALKYKLQSIGYDRTKTLDENREELIRCAKIYNVIYRVFGIYGRVTSLHMISQFCLSAFVLAMTIVLTIYFTSDYASTLYTALYVINTIVNELLFTCWYGERLQTETEELTNACFNMNWMDQNKLFKQGVLMMMQRSQRNFSMTAGFMQINLRSFTQILRFAYSASLILSNMNNRPDEK